MGAGFGYDIYSTSNNNEYSYYRALTFVTLFILLATFGLGVFLPFKVPVLRWFSMALPGIFVSFIIGIILMIYALYEEKLSIRLTCMALFGFLEGLAFYYTFFMTWVVVPHEILIGALITTVVYFILVSLLALASGSHKVPENAVTAITFVALILAIIQLFLLFRSLSLIIIIDIVIIIIFSVAFYAFYCDIIYYDIKSERWLSNTLGIFLTIIGIATSILLILNTMYFWF